MSTATPITVAQNTAATDDPWADTTATTSTDAAAPWAQSGNAAADTTTAGRRPACSRPTGTPKSTSQISPRRARLIGGSPGAVVGGAGLDGPLGDDLGPPVGVASEVVEADGELVEEQPPLERLGRLVEQLGHRPPGGLGQP